MMEIIQHVPCIVATEELADKLQSMDLNGCWKKLWLVVVNPLVLELNTYSDLQKTGIKWELHKGRYNYMMFGVLSTMLGVIYIKHAVPKG
jgi:hypothetical protein